MEKLPNNRLVENLVTQGNISEQEKLDFGQDLQYAKHRGKEPVSERELEKGVEEERFIELAQKSVIEKIKSLGLEVNEIFNLEKIHLLPSDDYSALIMGKNGQHDVTKDRIKIRQQEDFFKFYQILNHELIHAYSWTKFYVNEKKRGVWRSGYSHVKEVNNEETYDQFLGFNEAIIEDLQREITYENASELATMTNNTETLIQLKALNQNSYLCERKLLHYVVNKFSAQNSIPTIEIWQKLRRGLFTGEMMFLRKFNKTFGKDTVRVLASYGAKNIKIDEEEYFESFKSYFDAPTEKRSTLAKKLIKRG